MIKVSKFSIFLIYFLFLEVVVSDVYRVGDEDAWNSGTGINYLAWSKQYNFTVGDVLVFAYSRIQHNVKEVTDATFRTCDTRSGVILTYQSGNDEIRLEKARKYNFVCDIDDHCLGGMRFSINVLGGSNGNNTAPTEPPTPLSQPPPPPPGQGGESSGFVITGKVICTVGMLALHMFLF